MKKPAVSKSNAMPSLALHQESATLSRFPHLADLLLNPNWDDATAKGKRCLMVFIDDSAIRVLVKMEGDGLKTSVPAHGLDDALASLEKLLATNQVIWEQDGQGKPPARKKKA